MHTFRTPIQIESSQQKINIKQQIFSMGSCFSENIGQRLTDSKFDILTNPFGVLYNPVSIFTLMEASLKRAPLPSNSIVQNEGVFRSLYCHSDISAPTLEDFESLLDQTLSSCKNRLNNASWLLLTFGSSFVFDHLETGILAGNCHKIPQKEFQERMLTLEEIKHAFNRLYPHLPKDCQIILTVSPVRHLRNGLSKNNLSKSLLRLACEALSAAYNNVHYFPSYEIMLDDLRDYRFYTSDMIHPSEIAIDYIWEQFQQTYLDEESKQFLKKWEKLKRAITHRPFNPHTEAHQSFIRNTIKKLEGIKEVNVEEEIQYMQEQLTP
ncbi:GSCFA domain-containing protein [Algivirga pacifica]|uniref:GSCFA domain-containing protein n=1 Tax=Algivirga pacifica TaxID=1162670 RepID=A0ABP9DFR0_9BACT